MLSRKRRRKFKTGSLKELFLNIAEEYGLYGKVVIHSESESGLTLHPIVEKKGDKPESLPAEFLKDLIDLLFLKTKGVPKFRISFIAKTKEEIRKSQEIWNALSVDMND